MFETAGQERTSPLWGIIIGLAALAVLLGAGYALIAYSADDSGSYPKLRGELA